MRTPSDCPIGFCDCPDCEYREDGIACGYKPLTCEHCGITDDEVWDQYVWVGGKGYVKHNYCLDRKACWERWEALNRNPIGYAEEH